MILEPYIIIIIKGKYQRYKLSHRLRTRESKDNQHLTSQNHSNLVNALDTQYYN